MRIYQFLWDKVTKCIYDPNTGTFYGLVLGGKPIPYREIANALHISWSTVQRSVEFLVSKRFIRTSQDYIRASLSFEVLDCDKHASDEQKEKVKQLQERDEKTWDDFIDEMDADITSRTVRCPICGGNDAQCGCGFTCNQCQRSGKKGALVGIAAVKKHLSSGHLFFSPERPRPIPLAAPPVAKLKDSVSEAAFDDGEEL